MPNWNVIRRKGESGQLNADETDALVALAHKRAGRCYYVPPEGGMMCCIECQDVYPDHSDNCPIAVLEQVTDDDSAVALEQEAREIAGGE